MRGLCAKLFGKFINCPARYVGSGLPDCLQRTFCIFFKQHMSLIDDFNEAVDAAVGLPGVSFDHSYAGTNGYSAGFDGAENVRVRRPPFA